MFSRDRPRITETERVKFRNKVLSYLGVDFVDGKCYRFPKRPKKLSQVSIRSRDFGAPINHIDDVRSYVERNARLLQDLAGDEGSIVRYNSARINQSEFLAVILGFPVNTIARNPGLVSDYRSPCSQDCIEES